MFLRTEEEYKRVLAEVIHCLANYSIDVKQKKCILLKMNRNF